jgi:hypothetical protein
MVRVGKINREKRRARRVGYRGLDRRQRQLAAPRYPPATIRNAYELAGVTLKGDSGRYPDGTR